MERQIDEESGSGPFLQCAFFCERALQEKDGTYSFVRVVDRITIRTQDPQAPDELPPVNVNLLCIVALKKGGAKGKHTISIQAVPPSEQALPETKHQVLFEGNEETGVTLRANVSLRVEHEGVYWFHVRLDEHELTRMPLRILYLKQHSSA